MEVEVLPDGELPVERVLLADDAEDLLRQRRVGDDVDAADERLPRGRDDAGREHPGGRRLAGAVGPEQAEDLAGRDAEVEPVDRPEVRSGVDLRQLDGADDTAAGARRAVRAAGRARRSPPTEPNCSSLAGSPVGLRRPARRSPCAPVCSATRPVSAGRREDNRRVRRARLPMLLLACLALIGGYVQGSAHAGTAPPAIRWPFSHLQLGLADAPGGAAGLAATAPFGLRYQYLAGGVNTGKDWQHWNPDGSFVSDYIAESEAHHIVPVFSYYEIRQSLPGAGVADETDRRPRKPRQPGDDARLLPHAQDVLRQARGPCPRAGGAAARARPLRLRRAARRSRRRLNRARRRGVDRHPRPAGPAQHGGRLRAGGARAAATTTRPGSSSATRSRSGARARTSTSATPPTRRSTRWRPGGGLLPLAARRASTSPSPS